MKRFMIFLGIGISLLSVGAYIMMRPVSQVISHFKSHCLKVQGRVVYKSSSTRTYRARRGNVRRTTYMLDVNFPVEVTRKRRGRLGERSIKYKLNRSERINRVVFEKDYKKLKQGDSVELCYLPSKYTKREFPRVLLLSSVQSSLWRQFLHSQRGGLTNFGIIFFIFGGLSIFLGIVFALDQRHRRRSEQTPAS